MDGGGIRGGLVVWDLERFLGELVVVRDGEEKSGWKVDVVDEKIVHGRNTP